MKNPPLLAFLLSCVVSTGDAQPTDPVVTHFREYRAALERNDLAAADAAATAAWEASEASQGSRSAVLALNLASLRLGMGDPARALEPAARAYELASSSADSGVDPLHASLILGRAQLGGKNRSSPERLLEAIGAAEAAGQPLIEAYDAAVALGEWALQDRRFSVAEPAWAAAVRLVEHSGGDVSINRGRARLLEGVAIFLGGVDRKHTGTEATPEAHAAFHAFSDALRTFEPYAFPDQSGEVLTVGQDAYAQALAWRGALQAKLRSQEQALSPSPELAALLADELDPRYCRLSSPAEPRPEYPRDVLTEGGVGAVVAHLSLDTEGNISKRHIAAAVPPGPLGDAVAAVYEQWRFEQHPSSAPDCSLRSSNYFLLQFVLQ